MSAANYPRAQKHAAAAPTSRRYARAETRAFLPARNDAASSHGGNYRITQH